MTHTNGSSLSFSLSRSVTRTPLHASILSRVEDTSFEPFTTQESMCSSRSRNYFNEETFVDGTGRGKSLRQVQFALQSKREGLPASSSKKADEIDANDARRQSPVIPIERPLTVPAKLESTKPAFLPCAQFPAAYLSSTSLIVLHWSKYHGRNVSFYLKDIGYFSTADRSDANRCREDFRYLKRLIYDIDDVRKIKQMNVEFDLNIGSAYLNPAEPSTSLDALLWWISRNKQTLLDHKGRSVIVADDDG